MNNADSTTAGRILLTPEDLAAMFGVSRDTILRWSQRGKIPKPVKIGKTVRWSPEAIDAVVAKAG